MKNFTVCILIVIISSCSILQKKPTELKGSFYQSCDAAVYRALTFEGNSFTEERMRPHLGTPIYYGMGIYELSEDELTLYYQEFDQEDAKIENYPIDTTIDDFQLIKLNFFDMKTEIPLQNVEVFVYRDDGEYGFHGFTDKDGVLMFELDLNPDLNYIISPLYPFYPYINIYTEEINKEHYEYEIYWKAGAQERKTEGKEILKIDDISEQYLNIKTNTNEICPFLREAAYKIWLNDELIRQKQNNR